MKGIIFLSFAFLLAVSAAAPVATHPAPDEYIPNEIIIKFRETVANTVEEQLKLKSRPSELALSPDLDELNARYRVKKLRPLFKSFRQRRQRLKALQQKSEAFLSQKEKRILRRLKRAPKDVKIPALDRIYKLELEPEEGQSLEEAVAAYRNNPDIEYAELNYIVSIDLTPNDPLYPLQWPLNNTGQMYPESGNYNHPPGTAGSDVNAPQAWDITTGSYDVVVAVIDTGIDYTHRDLDDNIWVNETELNGTAGVDDDGNGYIDDIYGYDFANDDPVPKDDHGHGTHCAGIIVAEGDNALDIAGVCWHARIMALKFLGSNGRGNMADAVEAFHYAVENGADVVSNSWGSGFPSQTIEQAINYAHSQGVIIVAAAGNGNTTTPYYPAYFDRTIAVAATNSNDQKAPFSNYGDWVDIAAPGVDILSLRAGGTSTGTTYDDYTTILSGTSMACPHVAAACAMLLSIGRDISIDQLRNALLQTADPVAPGICVSGRLNLYGAVLRILGLQGTVWLDSDVYPCSGLIGIKLFDTDLSTNATQHVTVSTDGGDFETVLLTETSPTFGIFVGTIPTTSGLPNVEDGTLQLSHGQIITAIYYDANDETGNPGVATDTAEADCQAPFIFNIEIDVPGSEPTVSFETDELTTARVLCGLDCAEPNNIIRTDSTLATSHTIKLIGVSPETDYFFIVEVTDVVDYITVDDNAGQCYAFTTTSDEFYVPTQCSTIQEAIDISWDGSTVWVADGIYTGPGNRDIDFGGRPITVKSENGPQNCIIDCNGTEEEPHRGFNFTNNEDANSVLDGLTITRGYATYNGGGINCDRGSSPTITNCTISGNSADSKWAYGGGIYCQYSSPTITNCTFRSNSVDGQWACGGAIYCENSSPTLTNCTIIGNTAALNGGGMNNRDSSPIITNCKFSGNSAVGNDGGAVNNRNSSPMITNCTFSANSAYDWGGAIRNVFDSNLTITNCTFSGNLAQGDGGAIFNFHNSNLTITNCTFAENSAPNGNAIAFDSWQPVAPSNLQATNCILVDDGNEIWNNDGSKITITYSNVQTGWSGEGNIDTDPCFVEPGYWDTNGTPDDANDDFWLDGDYHLLRTSPCIDAASDANIYTDIEGNIRPFDFPGADNNGELPDFDMGAYEVTAQEANLLILPRVIKRTSSQPRIMAWVHLPQAITKDQIGSVTPLVLYPGGIKATRQFVICNRRRGAQRIYPVRGPKRKVSNGASPAQRLTPNGASIFAFFDKAELMDAVDDNGRVQLQVLGHLRQPGRYFYGSDTITIKPQRQ